MKSWTEGWLGCLHGEMWLVSSRGEEGSQVSAVGPQASLFLHFTYNFRGKIISGSLLTYWHLNQISEK